MYIALLSCLQMQTFGCIAIYTYFVSQFASCAGEGGGGRGGSMNARYFPHWNLSGESGRVQIASQAYLGIVQNVSLAKSR